MASILLKNPSGRPVYVDENREELLLKQGFSYHKPGFKINESVDNKDLIIHRSVGGLGDMISLLPGLWKHIKTRFWDYEKFDVAIPKRYHFLFENYGFNLLDIHKIKNIPKFVENYHYEIDLVCPALEYEMSCNFDVKEGRLKNFWDMFQLEESIELPALKLSQKYIDNGKKFKEQFDKPVIGLQIMTANKSKDWPLNRWEELAKRLIKDGFQVVSFDELNVLDVPGVYNITRTPLEIVCGIIANIDYMITTDSGLMWVALAQGIKTFSMFGPTSGMATLGLFGLAEFAQGIGQDCKFPCYYSSKNNYHCVGKNNEPDFGECMKSISVDRVYNGFNELVRL